jgi:hypothetical protein
MSLMSRFTDRNDKVEALLAQKIVRGDRAIAEAIADAGTLVTYAPGQVIIEQGGATAQPISLSQERGRSLSTAYAFIHVRPETRLAKCPQSTLAWGDPPRSRPSKKSSRSRSIMINCDRLAMLIRIFGDFLRRSWRAGSSSAIAL